MTESGPTQAAKLLGQARRTVVFTGAGMSAESGVPTFRDALTGLWQRYDAQQLATPEAFDADPDLVWGWYEWRRAVVARARPHPGHLAVAAIEARAPHSVLITQNVDDLHERAGSTAPLHLHGSLFAPRCSACAHPASTGDPAEPAEGRRLPPPRCDRCSAPIRPGVVWFGEALPQPALEAAAEAAASCDVLLTVGTSGLVYPAAEIPHVAARCGATVIQVNPEPTPLDQVSDINLRGPAARVLPTLVDAAWGGAG
ncbi:SIR2 family NAD-dependent protein deacylase [Micromonospora maris]|uniref:NAD-dependent protein deacylase n=1 Tax=Micromonospora maris TaxID=1003110 RepID=A0A9X0I056_9ACTN|nr:NAD-dependent deacylase [Micromonospora maris]AEB44930.1 silent information regulator protein Sir2 [Micromonospora maris AB-18-032]KUJ44387.1 NAD-dependent deacylase [Micromonospora maris]